VLIDATGARIMAGVHPLGDLAPRDVVSLAVTRRLAGAPGGVRDHVFLDATGIAPELFARRFPTVSAACAQAGINPNLQPIPVAPAAHYHCGGIITDLHGRTTVAGLYAVGEVARTGLHGANRLASNSLLEGLVMGARAAEAVASGLRSASVGELVVPELPIASTAGRDAGQAAMSAEAGIGREAAGLARALSTFERTAGAVEATRASVEAANLALVSTALLSAAATRTESRGCHVRTDHPEASTQWMNSVVVRLENGQVVTRVEALRAAEVNA
jgi:L-aspartate oxidase